MRHWIRAVGLVLALASLVGCGRLPDIWRYETALQRVWQPSAQLPAFSGTPTSGTMSQLARDAGFQAFLWVQGDALVEEWYHPGRSAEDPVNIKSVSKTVLSALVGALAARGAIDIDAPIQSIGGCDVPALLRPLTARVLLNMSAGFGYVENTSPGVFREPDWVCATLALPVEAPSGQRFNYATLQSFLLGVHLETVMQAPLHVLMQTYVFEPIGIELNGWALTPNDRAFAGSELFLTPRDMARFGQLLAAGGRWDGVEVIPTPWVRAMQLPVFADTGRPGFGYGLGAWQTQIAGEPIIWAEGYGGQVVAIAPRRGTVLTFAANTGGLVSAAVHQRRINAALEITRHVLEQSQPR